MKHVNSFDGFVNEAKKRPDFLTPKDQKWIDSVGDRKLMYNDQFGSLSIKGDHMLSGIIALLADMPLDPRDMSSAKDFGFDHVDLYDAESGKTFVSSATADKYTLDKLVEKVKKFYSK
jgi:hypothetical protein